MKINGLKKNMNRWTALQAMLLCVAMCVSLVTGCGARPAEPLNPPRINGQIEQTEHAEPAKSKDPTEPTEPTEPATPAEPAEFVEPESTDDFSVKVTDLCDGVFHLEGDLEQDLTIRLPASWDGKYTYEATGSGVTFYDKAARADAAEGSDWGRLFDIRCIPGLYPLNYRWGYHARVLATSDAVTMLMEYPDEIQSAEMVESDEETTRAYLAMRSETDQVTVTLGENYAAHTWNEANWAEGTVTILQNLNSEENNEEGGLSWIPVVCDADVSAALREMFDGRTYGDSPYRYDEVSTYTVVTDEGRYDIVDLDEEQIIRDQNPNLVAEQPLTPQEIALFTSALKYDGQTWHVKVTDLGNDTFRVEDAGYTRGLDVTVKLPASWAGRYTFQSGVDGITFYCKATYDKSYDEGYHGVLGGIWVTSDVMSPDSPMYGDSRVLAMAGNYSVVLSCPGDIQFTEETAAEYQAMYADMDKMEITLSDWMLTNTWNETNLVSGNVSLHTIDMDGEHTVICDADASAVIRQMLESRTYAEHEDWWRDLTGARMEIKVNGVTYTLHEPQGSSMENPFAIYRNDKLFAATWLTKEEVAWLRTVLDNGGKMMSCEFDGSRYTIYGCNAKHLDWKPGAELYFVNPAFWGERFTDEVIEGSAHWANEEKTWLTVNFTWSDGHSATGAMDGPKVAFTVNLDGGVVREKSLDSVDLSDEELREIAVRTARIMRAVEVCAQ